MKQGEYVMLHPYDPKSIWYLDRTRYRDNSIIDRFTVMYFRKRSEVVTRTGGVIYRRRIFRWFGLRQPCFIDYYFRSVDDIDDDMGQSYWVTGRITAVYLFSDGEAVHHTKDIKHVSLPKCFQDMAGIRKALDDLQN